MGIRDLKMTGNHGVIDNHLPDNRAYNLTTRYNEIRLLEPLISADMRKLAIELDTDFIGSEYSVKTASSVEDKLQRIEKELGSQFDPMAELLKLKDLVRYTEICNHDDIMSVAKQTIANLHENNYVLSGIRNYYAAPYPNTGYQGLHLNFITPYGQEIELQIHSEQSFEAKQQAHGLYEKIRSVSTLEDDKVRLKEEINRIHSAISKPSGYEEFPIKFDLEGKEKIMDNIRNNVDVYFEETRYDQRPYALTYSVVANDEQLLCGFENVFSDGSASSYQNNIRDGIATYSSLDKNGAEIITRNIAQREISLTKALEIAIHLETTHDQWMAQNFSEKSIEDLDLTHKNINDNDYTMQITTDIEQNIPELF